MTDDFCGRIKESRMEPECLSPGCPLPIYCHGHCDTCLLHCAGTTGWYSALRYWLRVWWQAGPDRVQGGWTFRNWWDVLQFWPWLWYKIDRRLWPLKQRYCNWRGIPWWL